MVAETHASLVVGIHLEAGDPELERAWLSLGDPVALDDATGECWQYLGTTQGASGRWHHQFRHRHHPATNKREYIRVLALDDWQAGTEIVQISPVPSVQGVEPC